MSGLWQQRSVICKVPQASDRQLSDKLRKPVGQVGQQTASGRVATKFRAFPMLQCKNCQKWPSMYAYSTGHVSHSGVVTTHVLHQYLTMLNRLNVTSLAS